MVLTRGMELRLTTSGATLQLLRDRAIEVHVEETSSAVEVYNRLARGGAAVGGLFHSTC